MVERTRAEVEFSDMDRGICGMLWLKMLLEELRMPINIPKNYILATWLQEVLSEFRYYVIELDM